MTSISTFEKSLDSKMILMASRINSPKPKLDSEGPKISKSNTIFFSNKMQPSPMTSKGKIDNYAI